MDFNQGIATSIKYCKLLPMLLSMILRQNPGQVYEKIHSLEMFATADHTTVII